MSQSGTTARAPLRRTPYILGLTDFDAPQEAKAAPARAPDPLPGLLEAARAEGFAAGREAGLQAGRQEAERSLDAAVAMALREAAAALALGATEARDVAEDAAHAVARATLAALLAVLPTLQAQLGQAEVQRFAAALLPNLATEPSVVLRVAPDLVVPVAAHFAPETRLEVAADAALQPGEARLTWRDGTAERKAAAAVDALHETLAELGLA